MVNYYCTICDYETKLKSDFTKHKKQINIKIILMMN